jgi:IS5 family transposase
MTGGAVGSRLGAVNMLRSWCGIYHPAFAHSLDTAISLLRFGGLDLRADALI